MKKLVLVVIAFLCLLMVERVQAQCTFSDVPESHIFYDEVTAMCELGITTGYSDGTYRPGNNVTRGQMSSFVIRTRDSMKLACVTAMMNNPTDTTADIMITNAKNVTVSDWTEVFNAIYVQENPYNPEDIYWGLQCQDDWSNTGCSSTVDELAGVDQDLQQFDNGCFSDDEEIAYLNIFTTCCKIL
jgi:hypothetical protein